VAQTPGSQRLAIVVVLAVNAGDLDALSLMLSTMTRGEMADVIESLGELAESGVRGRAGGAVEAREALVNLAESITGE
jgi:hypothetical protein